MKVYNMKVCEELEELYENMRLYEEWERLYEIKGKTITEVKAWLKVNDKDYNDDFEIINDNNYSYGYVGGYYSHYAPCIVFENGKVVRWYRGGIWLGLLKSTPMI